MSGKLVLALRVLSGMAALLASPRLWSEVVESRLSFQMRESEATYSVAFSTGGSAIAYPTFSGNLEALVAWDDATLQPQAFTFENSWIELSSFALELPSRIRFTGAGNYNTVWHIGLENPHVSFVTFNQPGRISAATGRLESGFHSFTTDRGRLFANVVISSLNQTVTSEVNFQQEPEAFLFSPMPKLTIQQVSANDFRRTLRFELLFEYDQSESELIEDTNARLTTTEAGRILWAADYDKLTPLGEWADRYGLGTFARDAVNAYGIPLRLLCALDLPPTYSAVPLSVSLEADKLVMLATRAGKGVALPVFVEYSIDLADESWERVPLEWLIYGEASLAPGAGLPLEVQAPLSAGSLFLRVVVP